MKASRDGKRKVAHILPSMVHGGVEIAVSRSLASLEEEFDYRVFTVKRRGTLECGQATVGRLLIQAATHRWRPDVAVTSLWAAHAFGPMLRSLGACWVAFFHSTAFRHPLDERLQRMAWLACDQRLTDSHATREFMQRVGPLASDVVPFIFDAPEPKTRWADRDIDVVWVGRNHSIKRLDLVESLLRRLEIEIPNARATLVVSGQPHAPFETLVKTSSLHIDIHYNLDNREVRRLLQRARFSLLLSDAEGMSMSTIEAIQAGCLPVVRLVGGLRTYLSKDSAVIVEGDTDDDIRIVGRAIADLRQDEQAVESYLWNGRMSVTRLPRYITAMKASLRSACAGRNFVRDGLNPLP